MQKQRKINNGKSQTIDHTCHLALRYMEIWVLEQKLINKHRQVKAKMEEYIRYRKLLNTEL
jgi:hypothetical protein